MLSHSIIYLFRILFVVDTLFTQLNTSPSTITIDIDKGIIFQQLGYYSEKLEHKLFHIFVPFNNLCIDSPNSDVCHYLRSRNVDIEEIGTIESYAAQVSLSYNRKTISNIIEKDIRRVFYNHEVKRFLDVTKSMIYFTNDHFYLSSNFNDTTVPYVHPLPDHNEPPIQYGINHLVSLVLQQIISKKIGYDFLTDGQIAEILPLIISNTSQLFDAINIRQNMNAFIDTIIGQSIFIMESCSINNKENIPVTSSCLVISSLIQQLPLESSSIYKVYRTLPLPISFEGHQYVYENLPQIFGYNVVSKNVIIWNDDDLISSCLFSKIIQCRFNSIIVELSKLPCLSELLGIESLSSSQCQVSKSKNFQTGVLNVGSNIWYFYSSAASFLCQSNSPISATTNAISVRPPMLVTFPCGEEIECSQMKLPATECTSRSLNLKTKNNFTLNESILFSISLMNITDRLLSLHKGALRESLKQLQEEVNNSRKLIDKIVEDFINSVISVLSLFILSVALIVIKYIKNKTTTKIEKLQIELNRLQKDFINEV